jgi:SHS2 domain-containing protein
LITNDNLFAFSRAAPGQAADVDAMIARWEHFDHEADIGVRGFGATKAAAFAQAARAMTAAITDLDGLRPEVAVDLACEAPDDEILLVDWLNALVYAMATRHLLFGRFEVAIDGPRLTARAWGEPVDAVRHAPAVEVKGATFTALRVRPCDDGWVAQCVIDV